MTAFAQSLTTSLTQWKVGWALLAATAQQRCSKRLRPAPGGVIEIDFLRGHVVRGRASQGLESAAVIFGQAFPNFCKKNGVEATDFRIFLAAFDARGGRRRAMLIAEDSNGRRSLTEY